MNDKQFILSLDQGTTSSRALLIDRQGRIVKTSQKEFGQIYPKPGWVEHDPDEIWSSQISVARGVIEKAGIEVCEIAAIGIANQRETTIVWDRETGRPIYNAIVWQDRRTAQMCDRLKRDGYQDLIQCKTGLVIDAYFSATKLQWILNNVEGAREKAEKGDLAFGTVDSWLIWNLTGWRVHTMDVTNASRTMLFNIHDLKWDAELLDLLKVPSSMLPEVKSCSDDFGETTEYVFGESIPICGVAGDQQAALFGQMCVDEGMIKCTYGTGSFIVMNTGEQPVESSNNLLTTVAWKIGEQKIYALEGSVFIAGAVVQWLRDGLKIIKSSSEIEALALSVEDNGGVYFVPAFTGLGAPYWDQYARGTIVGLTRGVTNAHIARAALEAIVYQVYDVLGAMRNDSSIEIRELRVDGGASKNTLLMQFQSNILGVNVVRPSISETTALGAAYFAGLKSGFWNSVDEIQGLWKAEKEFIPSMDRSRMDELLKNWKKAVDRSKGWALE